MVTSETQHSRESALDSVAEEKLAELGEDLQDLFPVNDKAAGAYRANTPTLIEDVNGAILERSDVKHLIGACPVDDIMGNHHNHARFMATVFAFNLPFLLVRVIPWAYRAYTSHGVSYDYFCAELEAWQTAVQKHLNKSHAQPIRRIYDWMLRHHKEMKQLSEDLTGILPRHEKWTNTHDRLLSYLLSGNSRGMQDTAHNLAPDTEALPGLYIDNLQPVMYEVGSLWAKGEISVSKEHMATAMVNRVVATMYKHIPDFETSKGKVVVACATDEFHELGPRIVADLLELDGWDVDFLGANVPVDDFHETVASIQPHIIALSAAVPHHLLKLQDMLDRIHNDDRLQHTRTMVGGVAFSMAPGAADALTADGWACDGRAAVEMARNWQEEGSWN